MHERSRSIIAAQMNLNSAVGMAQKKTITFQCEFGSIVRKMAFSVKDKWNSSRKKVIKCESGSEIGCSIDSEAKCVAHLIDFGAGTTTWYTCLKKTAYIFQRHTSFHTLNDLQIPLNKCSAAIRVITIKPWMSSAGVDEGVLRVQCSLNHCATERLTAWTGNYGTRSCFSGEEPDYHYFQRNDYQLLPVAVT